MGKIIKIIISLIFILFLSGCIFFHKSLISLVDSFPMETDVPGWQIIDKPKLLSKEWIEKNEQDKIQRGLFSYGIAKYHSLSDDQIYVNVIISKFKRPLDAFSGFSEMRNGEPSKSEVKANYFLSDKGLTVWDEKFIVEILINSEAKLFQKELTNFYSIIKENLKDKVKPYKLPEYCKIFVQGDEFNKLVYYKNYCPFFPEIGNVFLISKNFFDKDVQIFFSKKRDKNIAKKIFYDLIKANSDIVMNSLQGINVAIKKDSKGKNIFFVLHKEWFFGIINMDSIPEGNRVLQLLISKIKLYEK